MFRSSGQQITEVHDVIPTAGQHIAASFLSEQPKYAVPPIRSELKNLKKSMYLKAVHSVCPFLLCSTV